ncbi:DUF6541 family protein [Microbacterium sp. BDGP8]|uniref:DUF6541 family protein n=1 Tax=unclassified Microbacterium TaxID=2609290 RepID=UPI00249E6AA3|nr:DUF6541 family protein [Microbacterium sp. BDGP8]WHE35500.1 hypothetical protein P6897_12480 [Microbacterium sp. BDGP8]
MTEWFASSPAYIVAAIVVLVPGLGMGSILRLRSLALWALAPAFTVVMAVGSALVLGLLGLPWSPVSALIAFAGLLLLVWGIRWALPWPGLGGVDPRRGTDTTIVLIGLLLGVVLLGIRFVAEFGTPDAISQTNDAAFHLSAVRFATETGIASPLAITEVIGARGFYPSAWHTLAALIPPLTGASIPLAANAVTFVIGVVVWPLGLAFLAFRVAGPVAAGASATVAGAVMAFPLGLVQWGVLYPQLLAGALLPAAVATTIPARVSEHVAGGANALERRVAIGAVVRGLAVVLLPLGAVMVAQPSTALAWGVAALALLLWSLPERFARRKRAGLTGLIAAVAAAGALIWVWWYFGASVSATWEPHTRIRSAAIEVGVNGFLGYAPALSVSIAMLLGLLAGLAAGGWRIRAIASAWAVSAGLYVVAAAVGSDQVRAALVGPWYEDPYRLAAIVPVFGLVLAGAAVAAVADRISALARRRTDGYSSRALVAGAVGLLLCVPVIVQTVATPRVERRDVFASETDPHAYEVSATSFVSEDELALLERLDDVLPEDAVVIANPSTGASFGYALSGRDVIPRTWAPPSADPYWLLAENLRNVSDDPAVCDALAVFGADYLLDFGPGEWYPGRWMMPGFADIDERPGFQLVDREGDASLWRVTSC